MQVHASNMPSNALGEPCSAEKADQHGMFPATKSWRRSSPDQPSDQESRYTHRMARSSVASPTLGLIPSTAASTAVCRRPPSTISHLSNLDHPSVPAVLRGSICGDSSPHEERCYEELSGTCMEAAETLVQVIRTMREQETLSSLSLNDCHCIREVT